MRLDLSGFSYDGIWYDFKDGARLKIRPYPASMATLVVRTDEGLVISGRDNFKIFDYCLTGSDNLDITINGEPVQLTQEVKKTIFDFQIEDIPAFVLGKVRGLEQREENAQKN